MTAEDCGPDEDVFDEGIGCTSTMQAAILAMAGLLVIGVLLFMCVVVRRRCSKYPKELHDKQR